jgi:hypothetical protein
MRYLIIALAILLCPVISARAQISVDIGIPGLNIGINMPAYPELVRVPGYPVYYDPRVNSNYFFYDGLFWVYQADNWYASSWYNGPWQLVGPEAVPLFILRVPVRYYRYPPTYFRGWSAGAPPHWGEHWGRDWEQRRSGWDQWDHRSVPAAAPLPIYQRQYSGDRYPRAAAQQQSIRTQNYHYQPHEAVTQQRFQQGNAGQQQGRPAAAPAKRQPQAQPQAPVQQGSPTQAQQQHLQSTQQRRQPQPAQAQPAQPVRQAQPPQPAQMQNSQNASQHRGVANRPAPQENKAAPQGRGPETKAAPQGRTAEQRAAPQENKAAPQARSAEKRTAPQESKAAPQSRRPENKPAPQDKGAENKKE